MTAVAHFGGALKYASSKLQRDKEVVMAAATHSGAALKHASAELQGNKEVVLAAAMSYGRSDVLCYVSNNDELFSDLDFVASLMHCFPHGMRLTAFRELARNFRMFLKEVINVVDCGKMTEDEIAAASGLCEDQWQSRLAEIERCVSTAFPDVSIWVVEYYGFETQSQLLLRLKEYQPVLSVLMDRPNTSWVEAARDLRQVSTTDLREDSLRHGSTRPKGCLADHDALRGYLFHDTELILELDDHVDGFQMCTHPVAAIEQCDC